MRRLSSFANMHRGSDIYVLGSGPSLSFIDAGFFRNKIVVATNEVAERMGLYAVTRTVYTHSHYHVETVELALRYPKHYFFCPNGDRGFEGTPKQFLDNLTYYPHRPTKYDFNVDDAWPLSGGLIVGSTSTHGAMHLACLMGASNVILAGVDCGMIDGAANQEGYVSGNLASPDPLPWLARWEEHLRSVKARLVAEYGVRIYSLNPFMNMNLEGHTWTGPSLKPDRSRLCRTCGMDCADLH
jgi:hypothetical protein